MWVTPFGNLRITGRLHLPEAYRSLPRPSSPPRAKASTVRSFFLFLMWYCSCQPCGWPQIFLHCELNCLICSWTIWTIKLRSNPCGCVATYVHFREHIIQIIAFTFVNTSKITFLNLMRNSKRSAVQGASPWRLLQLVPQEPRLPYYT